MDLLDDMVETIQTIVAPEAPAAPTVKVTKPILEETIDPSETIDLRKFYRLRAKNPSLYNYDGRGNLVVRESNGSIKTTIKMKKYRSLNPEEFADMEEKRREAIIAAEEEFDNAMEELRQIIEDFREGRVLQHVLKDAQLAVYEADMKKSMAKYPEYIVRELDHIDSRIIYPDETFIRKVPHTIIQAYVGEHPIGSYMKAMTEDEEADEEAKVAEEAEEEVRIGNGEEPGIREVDKGMSVAIKLDAAAPTSSTIIVFNRTDDNSYGYLANDYPCDINWKGVKYFTVDQALASEKAKFFGRPADVSEIMKTRSATTMRSIARKIGEPPTAGGTLASPTGVAAIASAPLVESDAERVIREQKNAEWEKQRYPIMVSILLAKFRQHAQLGKLLMETGDAILARADHRDIEDGIGLSITDERQAIQSKWRGKNLLGKALMEVRTTLRSGQTESKGNETDVITKEAISEEAAAAASKAKAATVINRRLAARSAAATAPTRPATMIPLSVSNINNNFKKN